MLDAAHGPLDILMFAVLPYTAMAVFFIVTIQRYRQQSFSYSSLSSQFLENKRHFWGMVPFHYGVLFILVGHVVAFLIPRSILWWNSYPLRLYILEVSAFIGTLLTIAGLISLAVRRLTSDRLRVVTSTGDWILFGLLLFQVLTGAAVALFYSWGSSWFASTLAPYLWSLVKLNPDIAFVTPLPFMVKLHILGAFGLIAYFPFTRLVHVLVIPNMYFWRRAQLVRWYGIRKRPVPRAPARRG